MSRYTERARNAASARLRPGTWQRRVAGAGYHTLRLAKGFGRDTREQWRVATAGATPRSYRSWKREHAPDPAVLAHQRALAADAVHGPDLAIVLVVDQTDGSAPARADLTRASLDSQTWPTWTLREVGSLVEATAVLADPAGAAFGLIPLVGDASAAIVEPETVGRIAWLTLVVPDVPSACEFYERVVGWSAGSTNVEGEFELRRSDGGASAAICHAGGDHEGVPPAWILGLPVGDLDASLRLVRENGGEIINGSTETGRAVIRDPIGVVAGLQANR